MKTPLGLIAGASEHSILRAIELRFVHLIAAQLVGGLDTDQKRMVLCPWHLVGIDLSWLVTGGQKLIQD